MRSFTPAPTSPMRSSCAACSRGRPRGSQPSTSSPRTSWNRSCRLSTSFDNVLEDVTSESARALRQAQRRLPRHPRQVGQEPTIAASARLRPTPRSRSRRRGPCSTAHASLPRSREFLIVAQHRHRDLAKALRHARAPVPRRSPANTPGSHSSTLSSYSEDKGASARTRRAPAAPRDLSGDVRLNTTSDIVKSPHVPGGSMTMKPTPTCRRFSTLNPQSISCGTRSSAPTSIPSSPAEFTNWQREQRAWRETACLFDQSHHMVNLFLKGPDAIETDLRTPRSTASRIFPSTWRSSTCRRLRQET